MRRTSSSYCLRVQQLPPTRGHQASVSKRPGKSVIYIVRDIPTTHRSRDVVSTTA